MAPAGANFLSISSVKKINASVTVTKKLKGKLDQTDRQRDLESEQDENQIEYLSFSPESFGIKVPKTPIQLINIRGIIEVANAPSGLRSTIKAP